MKKLFLIFVSISFLLGVQCERALSQERVSAYAQVSASVIIPIAATETSQLNFGRFYPGTSGGTISISPDGYVMTSSTVVADASPRSPGSFLVSGQGDATYAIDFQEGSATLINSESKTMEVSDWVTIPETSDSCMKLAGGSQTVMVGATLKVGSLDENPKGIYTGSYQITFAYN
jgi:hypothetical protein